MTSRSGDIRAGSFCTLGDAGQTAAGTPMQCTETGDGKRARWRKAPGAVPASRVRKRASRTRQQRDADKLRPSELTALRVAAGLPQNGPLPRQKRQYAKLTDAGFLDQDGNVTPAGRDALSRRNALDSSPVPASSSVPAAGNPASEPMSETAPVDRSNASDTDWSIYDSCITCSAAAGQPCHDLRSPGSLNATAHDGRPILTTTTPAPTGPVGQPTEPAEPANDDVTARIAADLLAMRDHIKTGPDHGVTREGAGALLTGLTIAQLHDVAGKVRAAAPYLRVRSKLTDHIVQNTVGFTLSSYAINPRWPGRADAERKVTAAEDRSVDAGTDWSQYGDCADCVASTGEACYDLGRQGSRNATPHPGRAKLVTEPATEPVTDAQRILDAAERLRAQTGQQWVPMADVRAAAGLPDADFDQAVSDLHRNRKVRAEPQVDHHRLDDTARAAAVVIGGEPRHLIGVGDQAPGADTDEGRMRTARTRQDQIDRARDAAAAAASAAEHGHPLTGSPDFAQEHVEQDIRRRHPDWTAGEVTSAAQAAIGSADPWEVARSHGATPIGQVGTVDRYDPNLHDVEGDTPEPGAPVFVNRPGAQWNLDQDGPKVLDRAKVTPTEEPVDRSRDAGTDWSAYGLCQFCGAASGQPCYDLGRPGSLNAHPHDGRPATSVPADPYGDARRRDIEADRRLTDSLVQAAADGDFTSHEAWDACSLGLWHTGPCPPRQTVTHTDRAPLPNHWGVDDGQVPVAYHPDGPVGVAVRSMSPADRSIDVGNGETLENQLGRAATRMSRGRTPFGQVVDEYRRIRDGLPAGSTARRHLDTIMARLEGPTPEPPSLPDNTPEPVRRLMATLNEIPLARVPSPETGREADTAALADLMRRFQGRPIRPRVLAQRLTTSVLNRHHESLSDVGKATIDQAVFACAEELTGLE